MFVLFTHMWTHTSLPTPSDRQKDRQAHRQAGRLRQTGWHTQICHRNLAPHTLIHFHFHLFADTEAGGQTETDTDMQPKLVPPSSHSLSLFVQRITAFPLTGTKFLALWHSSKMRQPSNCGPPHQSISCCSRVLRVLLNFPGHKHTQSKQQQNVNKERNQTPISTENWLLNFPEKITSMHNQNLNKETKQLYQQKTSC